MHFDAWTLALQAVDALVLVWLLTRLLFRPVAALMASRQAMVDQALAAAEAARAEYARLQEQMHQALAQQALALEAQRQAAVQGQAQAAQAASLAQQEALRAQRQAAQQELAALRDQARRAGELQALDFSLALALRLLQRLPDEVLVQPFLPGLAEALAALPPALLTAWCRQGETAELRSARALDATALDRCRQCLQQAIGAVGTLPPLRAVHDASLVAGLELVGAHLRVANHLAQDWTHLRDHLKEDVDA